MKKKPNGDIIVEQQDVDAIARVNKLKPDVRQAMKGVKGYRETEKKDKNGNGTGEYTWKAPNAAQAYGEMMTPFWQADLARHQQNRASMGEFAYEAPSKHKGKSVLMTYQGKLYRLVNDEWVPA